MADGDWNVNGMNRKGVYTCSLFNIDKMSGFLEEVSFEMYTEQGGFFHLNCELIILITGFR